MKAFLRNIFVRYSGVWLLTWHPFVSSLHRQIWKQPGAQMCKESLESSPRTPAGCSGGRVPPSQLLDCSTLVPGSGSLYSIIILLQLMGNPGRCVQRSEQCCQQCAPYYWSRISAIGKWMRPDESLLNPKTTLRIKRAFVPGIAACPKGEAWQLDWSARWAPGREIYTPRNSYLLQPLW